MTKLKWKTHADLAIQKTASVGREEYLDHMTFQSNERPLFTEIFGPLLGLKEEWEEQGATPAELDFSALHRPASTINKYRTAWAKPLWADWLPRNSENRWGSMSG